MFSKYPQMKKYYLRVSCGDGAQSSEREREREREMSEHENTRTLCPLATLYRSTSWESRRGGRNAISLYEHGRNSTLWE